MTHPVVYKDSSFTWRAHESTLLLYDLPISESTWSDSTDKQTQKRSVASFTIVIGLDINFPKYPDVKLEIL